MNEMKTTHSALAWFLVRNNTTISRTKFDGILKQHNLAHHMPRERHIADACRAALQDVGSLPPVEIGPGETARIISAPVAGLPKGEYAWDLHLQAQNRKEGQVEYPRLGQLRLSNGIVTAHLEDAVDVPLVVEMMLEAVIANLPQNAKRHQETLDANQIRSFLNDALDGHRFPIRPGVFFCLASSLPKIAEIEAILRNVDTGSVQCSVYHLEPSSQNIRTLQVDLVGSIEEELDKIEDALVQAAQGGKIGKSEVRDNLSYLACLRANLDEFEGLLGFKPVQPERLANIEQNLGQYK